MVAAGVGKWLLALSCLKFVLIRHRLEAVASLNLQSHASLDCRLDPVFSELIAAGASAAMMMITKQRDG